MSGIEATAYVMRLALATPAHKLVAVALATRCDQEFSCYPSRRLLAQEARVGEERVRTILRDLRGQGLVTARQRYRPNGSKTSNRYYLHGPWDAYGGRAPFPQIEYYAARESRYDTASDGEFHPGVADNPSPG